MRHRHVIGVLMVLALANNLLAYLRDTALAAFFGASMLTDAFFVGTFIPIMLHTIVVTGSLVPAFLPIFAQQTEQASPDAGIGLLNSLTRWLVGVLAVGVLLGEFLAPVLVAWIAPGFDRASADTAILLLRLSLPMLLFLGPSAVVSGVLTSRNCFYIPAVATLAFHLVVLGAVVAARQWGIWIVSIGMVVGAAAQCGLQLPALDAPSRQAVLLRLPNRDQATAWRVVRLAAPLLLFAALAQSVPLLERYMASSFAVGAISQLAYAFKLNSLAVVVVSSSFATLLFPELSRLALDPDSSRFAARLHQALVAIMLIMAPLAALMVTGAHLVVAIVYQHGSFSVADTLATGNVLRVYALGMLPLALNILLGRAFHARQNTHMPLLLGIFNTGLYVGAGLILTRLWGPVGLAAAFCFSNYTNLMLLTFWLAVRLKTLALDKLVASGAPIVSAACLSALAAWLFVSRLASMGSAGLVFQILALTMLALVVAATYLLAGLLLRIQALHQLFSNEMWRAKSIAGLRSVAAVDRRKESSS